MRLIAAFLLIAPLAACGPEPTDPAKTSLAGTWTSKSRVFTLNSINMMIVQEPNGIVSGTWTAKDVDGLGANGNLIGRNTVSQVEIEVVGAGRFEGGLVEANRMRGIFAIQDSYDTVTFVRSVAQSANLISDDQ
ncbi:MAG TPA: hypothetical protein VF042_17150 [Gemmatimonadaceae bacterium]